MYYVVPSFVSSGVISKVMEDSEVTNRFLYILGNQWTYATKLVIVDVHWDVMNIVVGVYVLRQGVRKPLTSCITFCERCSSYDSDHL